MSEQRLIDANALKKLVKEFRNDAPQSSVRKYVCDVILSMLGDENQTPTIEAEPVVHGRWIDNEDYMFCSECGMQWNYCDNDTQDFKFCPNCGSKIDGGAENG